MRRYPEYRSMHLRVPCGTSHLLFEGLPNKLPTRTKPLLHHIVIDVKLVLPSHVHRINVDIQAGYRVESLTHAESTEGQRSGSKLHQAQ